jgi:hypothetical protein
VRTTLASHPSTGGARPAHPIQEPSAVTTTSARGREELPHGDLDALVDQRTGHGPFRLAILQLVRG